MERSVAIKKLGKIFGKKLGYRVNDKAATLEERAAARAELTQAVADRNKLKEMRDERAKVILAADAQYQSLMNGHRSAAELADRLASIMRHRKFTVGTLENGFFFIKAEGDSWEEVIDKLSAEKQTA